MFAYIPFLSLSFSLTRFALLYSASPFLHAHLHRQILKITTVLTVLSILSETSGLAVTSCRLTDETVVRHSPPG